MKLAFLINLFFVCTIFANEYKPIRIVHELPHTFDSSEFSEQLEWNQQEALGFTDTFPSINLPDEFIFLRTRCFDLYQTPYIYTFCPFRGIYQQQLDAGQIEILLGTWSHWEAVENIDGYDDTQEFQAQNPVQVYTDGDACSDGLSRNIKVDMECGEIATLLHVNEPMPCSYKAKFTLPYACANHDSYPKWIDWLNQIDMVEVTVNTSESSANTPSISQLFSKETISATNCTKENFPEKLKEIRRLIQSCSRIIENTSEKHMTHEVVNSIRETLQDATMKLYNATDTLQSHLDTDPLQTTDPDLLVEVITNVARAWVTIVDEYLLQSQATDWE